MSSTYGEKIKISVFGESHGNGIGVVIDGLPAGVKIDMDKVLVQMSRRAPGKDKTATPRKESDLPKVLSGMLGDTLTGAPLCAVIEIQTQKAATTAIFSIVLVRVTATTQLMLNITQATIFAAAVIFRADLPLL